MREADREVCNKVPGPGHKAATLRSRFQIFIFSHSLLNVNYHNKTPPKYRELKYFIFKHWKNTDMCHLSWFSVQQRHLFIHTGNLLHILASLLDAPELMVHTSRFRVSEDLKWSLRATWMWQFIAAAPLWEREPLLGTSSSCQTGQFYPLFVLHQTQTITTLERVTDNESVKSMFGCSILYVPMGSSIRDKMTKCFWSIHFTVRFTTLFAFS